VWHFGTYNRNGGSWVWRHPDNYRSEVAEQMGVLRRLLACRPGANRMADIDPLDPSTRFKGNKRIGCLRDVERTYLMVYTPNGADVKVRMGRLGGSKCHGWWYNPRTGEVVDSGVSRNRGTVASFDPPGEPGADYTDTDWVLVLDDAACKYSKPGSSR
jgi:hypothetical protein